MLILFCCVMGVFSLFGCWLSCVCICVGWCLVVLLDGCRCWWWLVCLRLW